MALYRLKPADMGFFKKALENADIENSEKILLQNGLIDLISVDTTRNVLFFDLSLSAQLSDKGIGNLSTALRRCFPEYSEIRVSCLKNECRSEKPVEQFKCNENTDFSAVSAPEKNNTKKTVPISRLEASEGKSVWIFGKITGKEEVETKNGTRFLKIDIFDRTDSVCVKFFKKNDEFTFSQGDFVNIRGKPEFDKFEQELIVLGSAFEKADPFRRFDTSPEKRVELHIHSKMSAMDGMSDISSIVETAAAFGHKAIAITDHGVVQGFPEFHKQCKKHKLKPVFGMEGYLIDDLDPRFDLKKSRRYHINLLVKNLNGLKNLYRLVSQSHLNDFYKKPLIRKSMLISHRDGLLLGTACEAGELITQYLETKNDRQTLLKTVSFYDFVEIMPRSNNRFLIRKNILNDESDLEKMILDIYSIAEESGKICVATGDSHYIEPHDAINREIIQHTQGYEEANCQAELYFRTTDEMLREFSYLGKEKAFKAVVTNPAAIIAMIEDIQPIPDGFYPPKIAMAEDNLKKMVYENARKIYGSELPETVVKRLERELGPICRHGFSDLYYIAHMIVKFSLTRGYLVGSRGSVGSSLVATMAEITDVNPLPPHYICRSCQTSEFVSESNVECGADLPDKQCPSCGEKYHKDGFMIPFEVFLGFEGDKVPDIDLNFSGDIHTDVHRYAESIFGSDHSFKAGTISTFQDKAVKACIDKYLKEKNIGKRKAEIRRLISECVGIKRTTGQHPGGIIVVPEGKEIYDFCPVQHPADDKEKAIVTTHFDYHVMDTQLVKLDLLGHDNPTIIKMLEETTGLRAGDIPMDDPKTLALFKEVKTLGIPEFGTSFVRQVLSDVRPGNFGDIVRICGLTHGTDVWLNNAKELVESGISFSQIITMRDDILNYLVQQGLPEKKAFEIMEHVRKGKSVRDDQVALMKEKGVPDWYIESCRKIKYLFPKAHAVAYAVMAFQIAWFKVHHPLDFYAAYFSIRPDVFDYETVVLGTEAITRKMNFISGLPREEKTNRHEALQTVLEVAREMCQRGLKFLPINLYSSLSGVFTISRQQKGLICPFDAMDGVGTQAGLNVVEARREKGFSSIEDLQMRAKLNKTVVENLRKTGAFEGLPETEQLNLF